MMVDIVFYEKPGCINNTRQKRLLREAGHHVDARNLLTQAWTPEVLRAYFGAMPMVEWFNTSAPDIKFGRIEPAVLDEESALALMIDKPILIRRPLMRVTDKCRAGFDSELIEQWIGLNNVEDKEDLESCPQQVGHDCSTPVSKLSE